MLFINANIYTMTSKPITSGFVLTDGAKIKAVGDMQDAPKNYTDTVVDLAGKMLLPGFIDAHTHVGLFSDGLGAEGDDTNEITDPCTPHIRAIDGINPLDKCFTEALNSGVTCVVVSPGSANAIAGQICAVRTHGNWIDKMVVAEPLAMKFALGENPKMCYTDKAQAPMTRMATVGIIREQLQKAKNYYDAKQKAKDDTDPDSDSEPDYDIRLEALAPLFSGEQKAHFHAHAAYDILTAIRIAKEFVLDYTLIHCTEGHLIADILAAEKAKVVCGPLLGTRTKPELVNLSNASTAIMANAGVDIAISTDHPELPQDFLSGSTQIAIANGLSYDNALKSITINAARAVGLEQYVGSIEAGKDADLLVFTQDPLGVGAKPDAVYVLGEKVK